MNILNVFAAVMSVTLLIAAPTFAETPSGKKQKTQEGGGPPTPCNLVANPGADPDCNYLKQRTQNLTPSPLQATEEAAGNKK